MQGLPTYPLLKDLCAQSPLPHVCFSRIPQTWNSGLSWWLLSPNAVNGRSPMSSHSLITHFFLALSRTPSSGCSPLSLSPLKDSFSRCGISAGSFFPSKLQRLPSTLQAHGAAEEKSDVIPALVPLRVTLFLSPRATFFKVFPVWVGFLQTEYSYVWILGGASDLVFSEHPRSVFWDLSLILENSQLSSF